MRAYILTIGDEILIGQVTDTNAAHMATALSNEGVDVVEHLSVSDTRPAILDGLERALAKSDLVLMTGGLGPTKDDITKAVLAEYFATELVFHEPTWERLQALVRRFGREPNESHRVQCFLPAAAEILTNKRGTAPGMLFRKGRKMVVSMPGVPYEMRYLVGREVLPRLRTLLDSDGEPKLRSVTILTAGAGESVIAEQIAEIEASLPETMSLAYLPNLGTVRLRLSIRGRDDEAMEAELRKYRTRIEAVIGGIVYGYGNQNLAGATGEMLLEYGLTLGTVESCTGGRVAQLLTSNPGSSGYFHGSVISYDNRVKRDLLGVATDTLAEHGAVSEATVREMVRGGLKQLGTDVVVATSGIAGPGGGTEEKPVGTIWVAVGNQERIEAKLLRAGKDRERNITYTAFQALNLVRKFVSSTFRAN
ncbi:damage-inducible protein CinA [Lewinellaceae bacterium SD302]|nr:damage-inducible protein CinA [Lewinellaceae bacterium SD302]